MEHKFDVKINEWSDYHFITYRENIIKPLDPLFYEANYIEAALSCCSESPGHKELLKYYFDCLISWFWRLLRENTWPSASDELQELYQGHRSLRKTILNLNQPPPNNNLKQGIAFVVRDAGVFIFSLYHSDPERDLGRGLIHELVESINSILAELGEKVPQVPNLVFPKTNQLGYVDFVLEKLMELRNSETVQTIREELAFLRSFLEDIAELGSQEELQTLRDRVLEMAYRVESVIDHLAVIDLPDSLSFNSISEDLKSIKLEITVKRPELDVKRRDIKLEEVTTHLPSQIIPSANPNDVVGFADEAELITEQLLRGPDHLRVVAIVGMPGLGKTTLATKIYNDSHILYHFHIRAWCGISQVLDMKKVLLELLNQIDHVSSIPEPSEHDLVEKLWRSLKGRRYLIVLDDIWDVEAWNRMAISFPNDNVGSRILLTSRHSNVVPREMLQNQEQPHFLRQLNEEEGLELLQRKIFPGSDGWTPALTDLAMELVAYCKGLPLTINLVAGLLATSKNEESWQKIRDDLISENSSITEQCMNTLQLSYKNLPNDLRPCFLYFAVFPEDAEVSVNMLRYLWIAEGFVRKDRQRRIQDIAKDYLNGLIDRSLIMVSKGKWNGGVKTCRIHDLLHDLCLQKAKDEYFFHVLKGREELLEFNERCNLLRLYIQCKPRHFPESELFCPRARSLFLHSYQRDAWISQPSNASFVMESFVHLRVLDLQLYFLGAIPTEIGLLVQLAFLAIRGGFSHIPSEIAKLANLETLILVSNLVIRWSNSLWNLRKLKHLVFRRDVEGILPIENIESSPTLYELDTFSGVLVPPSGMEMLMRKFTNIRRLKCFIFWLWDSNSIVVPEFLRQLESLHMSARPPSAGPLELRFPENLKKLKLKGFRMSLGNMSTIGRLPNLQVLKLDRAEFEGKIWEMKEGEFAKLRILELRSFRLVRWTACDDLCLKKLELYGCQNLVEMPACLDYIPTLETIETNDHWENAVNLARQIEEQQKSWGNLGLKVIITHHP